MSKRTEYINDEPLDYLAEMLEVRDYTPGNSQRNFCRSQRFQMDSGIFGVRSVSDLYFADGVSKVGRQEYRLTISSQIAMIGHPNLTII